QRLDPTQFIRIHRSHIVRRDRVERLAHDGLGAWTVHLADGTALRIGRNHLAAVRGITAQR
ncbi:MAG: LytTR family DNA-binding domain-containing protein, partial [Sphingomonas sp.]